MMDFRKIVFLIMIVCSGANAQKPDLTGVRILTHPVNRNVYMLEATGDVAGNIAVLAGPEGFLLVDSQFSELADSIRFALRSIHAGQVEYIINTHYHEDHSDGNQMLRTPSTTIVASSNMRKRSSQRSQEAQPDITFERELSVFFNDEEVKLIHLPRGHTDTDVVVFFTKANVVHLGDLYNAGISSFPNVDLKAGGTLQGLLKNIAKLIGMIPSDAHIIPGHYELSDLAGLKACQEMLIYTIGFVKSRKETGFTLEQITKEGFPEKYRSWGRTGYTSADEWIENIYRGLIEN